MALGFLQCTAERPTLEQLEPRQGAAGSTLVLRGAGFCGPAGDCLGTVRVVRIGLQLPAQPCVVLSESPTELAVQVPPMAKGTYEVYLDVNGLASNPLPFTVTD